MSKEQTPTGFFVDVGSSTIKVGRSKNNAVPEIDTIYYNNRHIIDVGPYMDNGPAEIKIVAEDDLQYIKTEIHDRSPAELAELSITSAKKPLYIWRRDKDDNLQEILILDEPSLTTQLSELEDALIRETLHLEKPIDQNNPLVKILALKHNPRLVSFLFGEGAEFNELHFGTLTTFIRSVVTGDPDQKVGKNYILAFGMNGCQESDVLSLIDKLGLSSQLEFESEEVVHHNQIEIREGDDFRVELDTLKACTNEGLFPPGSIIIAADSVGKVIDFDVRNSSRQWGRFDAKQVALYETQRTFGQANNWLRPLVADQAKQQNIPAEAIIDEVLRKGYAPTDWYFDPHGNNENGAIYTRIKGGAWIEVPELELKSKKYIDQRKKIIRAVAWGVASAITKLIPEHSGNSNIYVYGGLVGEYSYGENLGWRRVIRAVMPKDREIHLIRLSSAAVAMWVTYMQQTGQHIDISQIIITEHLSGSDERKFGSGLNKTLPRHLFRNRQTQDR